MGSSQHVGVMETTHRAVVGDSREMSAIDDGEVDLVVTSPPYPLIEMWDETFAELNPAIDRRLASGAGREAFELMHAELAKTWEEVARVLTDGGIACINIGDATRKVGDSFERYPNHVRVTDWFTEHGFRALPDVLWRKPTNSAAKFMGSGMLPPNAYVTLEHEYVLIFRKGPRPRNFEPGSQRRYRAAYFWEERNRWFSDLWEVRGERQAMEGETRTRSGAFPIEIPYRLVNMFSVYGDTVLDPFWGTGTTSLAAAVAGRDSVGYELAEEFTTAFGDRLDRSPSLSREIVGERIERHEEFVRERMENGEGLSYTAENYDFPVMTKQEREIQLYVVDGVRGGDGVHTVTHSPVESVGAVVDAGSSGAGE